MDLNSFANKMPDPTLNIIKLKPLILIVVGSFLFTSCLKTTDPFGWDADEGSIVVEIYEASAYGPERALILNANPPSEQVDLLTIKFHAPRSLQPGNDIQVTLVEDPDAVIDASLRPLPANAFTLGNTTLTIPKNSGTVTLPITIEKNNLDLSQTYGIAFNISSVSEGTISDLAKSIVISISVKNEYDADYTVTGYFFHPSAGRAISATKHMTTAGYNRVQVQLGDFEDSYFSFDINGSVLSNWGAAGSTAPPPESGFMTSDNPGNFTLTAFQPGPPSEFSHATFNNSYDPTTKTFWLHYGYQFGSTGESEYQRQIYEKWVRQ